VRGKGSGSRMATTTLWRTWWSFRLRGSRPVVP
jgi:hypothetical protein